MIYITIALILALVATATYLALISSTQHQATTRSTPIATSTPATATPLLSTDEHRRAVEEANFKILTGEYSYP